MSSGETRMFVVTRKSGTLADPLRPVSQILRSSSQSGVLAKEEVVGILESSGIHTPDAKRLFRRLVRNKYLKEISFP